VPPARPRNPRPDRRAARDGGP